MKKVLLILSVMFISVFLFAYSGFSESVNPDFSINANVIGVQGTYGVAFRVDNLMFEFDLCMKSSPVAGIVEAIISQLQSGEQIIVDVLQPSGAFFRIYYSPVITERFNFSCGIGIGEMPLSDTLTAVIDSEFEFKINQNNSITLKTGIPVNSSLFEVPLISSIYSVAYCSSIGYRYTF